MNILHNCPWSVDNPQAKRDRVVRRCTSSSVCVNKYFYFNAKQRSLPCRLLKLEKHISRCSWTNVYRPRSEIESAGKCLMSSSGFIRRRRRRWVNKRWMVLRSQFPTSLLIDGSLCTTTMWELAQNRKPWQRASSLITRSITNTHTYKQTNRERDRQSTGRTRTHQSIHSYTQTHAYYIIHTYIHTYLPTYLPTYLHTYIHTYIH